MSENTRKRQFFRFDVSDETGIVSVYTKRDPEGEYSAEPERVYDPRAYAEAIQVRMMGEGTVKKITADTSDVSPEKVGFDAKLAAFDEVHERLLAGNWKKDTVRGPQLNLDHIKALALWQGISIDDASALIQHAPAVDRKLLLENPEFQEHLETVKAEKVETQPSQSLGALLGA